MTASLPRGLRSRALGDEDALASLLLSAEAGWNQSELDWRFMLRDGEGIGVLEGERLVGTALVLTYPGAPPVGWIGMVLVTASQRGRGLATWMMRWCLDLCAARRLVPMLDATPAGREVYRRLGFSDGPTLLRLRAPAVEQDAPATGDAALPPEDTAIFGADRSSVLRHLQRTGRVLRRGEESYAFARPGRIATHVGPIVARDDAQAFDLLRSVLHEYPGGPVMIDAFERHDGFLQRLADAGFAVQRPFTRMALGEAPRGRPDRLYAAAGPELG